MTIAAPKDYWIAHNAIYITLNALEDPDRIQGSVASGASILCYMKGIPGLEYDNGHNYQSWPLSLAPTYFNTTTPKYVYAAIPKNTQIGSQALVVFPSQQIDIYGQTEEQEQIGSTDYYYIWLQGIISASVDGNSQTQQRTWIQEINTGLLSSDEALANLDTDWYSYSQLTSIVTFLKGIIMDAGAYFKNLIVGEGNTKGELKGVATNDNTSQISDNSQQHIVTPSYLTGKYLSKTGNDTAQGIITFLRGICFGASQDWKITGDGDATLHDINAQNAIFNTLTAQNAHFFNLIIDEIKSVGGQLIITPANCRIDKVVELENNEGWKCYFKKSDGTRTINNQWVPGMQAIHQEFNVADNGTRNYWRVVTAIGEEVDVEIDEENIFDCHYIILGNKQGEYKNDSSLGDKFVAAPQAGDDLSQLGFNEAWCLAQPDGALPSDYKQLENAIVLSAYNIPFIYTGPYKEDANGIQAPLYAAFSGINDFRVTEDNLLVGIAGNGHTFKGRVIIEQGSTLADGRDVNNLGVQEGNLLRNSGFTGDYDSIEVDGNMDMSADTEVYSEPLKYWLATDANGRANANAVEVIEESNAVSGYAAVINGNLSQEIDVYPNTWYMLMFKAYISDNTSGMLSINLGGNLMTKEVTYSAQRFALPILTGNTVEDNDKKLVLSGEGITVYDLMLVQGNIPTEYKPSEKDNDKTLAELLNLEYLRKAIYEANTEIIGGLIMSQLIKVGNYINGRQMNTGGMSGLYTDENSPFLWGGGTFEQAIETIMYYASRRPEHYYDESPEGHVNFAVTHGGTAILNDIILRGYINAIGGIFKNVRSANGKWSLDEDGYMRCVNAWISGSIYTPYTIINNDNIEDNSTIRQITIRWGITEITRDVRVLNLEKTGFNLQIDYQNNESMPLFIMLPEDDGLIGAEVNVFQNSIHRCALVHISKVSMDDNRYYEYFNPILLKGQKIKLKCFKDGDTNRWFPEAYTDALRFRTPLEIAYVEVEVIKVNDEWILREIVGRYHSEARFQYVRDNVGKYIVTLPSDWRSVGVIGCDIVPHSYVMMEYNRGAYASVIDKDPVNSSFTIQVADDDSVNDGNFGFTIYLNRDEESIDINPILNNE